MKKGICKTKDGTVLRFKTIDGAECLLSFGMNTKFSYNFRNTDDDKFVNLVSLSHKQIEVSIPTESFTRLFRIID